MIKFDNGFIYKGDEDGENYELVDQYMIGSTLHDIVDNSHAPKLKDILLSVRNYHILMSVFPRFFIIENDIEEAIKSDKAIDNEIEYLKIVRHTSYIEMDKLPTFDLDEMDKIGPNDDGFFSVSPVVFGEDQEEGYKSVESYCSLQGHGDEHDNDVYSVSLTPINEIIEKRVHFGGAKVMIEINNNYKTYSVENESSMTLFEVIHAIIEDLTFHGSSNEKNNIMDELKIAMDEIKRIEKKSDDDDCDPVEN